MVLRKLISVIIAVIALVWLAVFYSPDKKAVDQSPAPPQGPGAGPVPSAEEQQTGPLEEIIAENLEIPWEIEFLPNGEILVTERPGRLLKIGRDKKIFEIQGVQHVGEGGLMGMALHPDFEKNNWIYLYLTTKSSTGLINRVERYRFSGERLTDREVIIDDIPGAIFHDGGRIAFSPTFASSDAKALADKKATGGKPDYYLYITTGDATRENLAQDKNSLAGKILRLKDDGSVPEDNPFGNAVYSYGHRNSQGLAWDREGRLWATEHGRSGIRSGLDELNLIEKGTNYGWPVIQGDETRAGMRAPIIHSGPDTTWAPAGAVYWNGRILFVGLKGETVYEALLTPDGKVEQILPHFKGKYGRIRAIKAGPGGSFYITTSNRDGRGNIRAGDDKIIRLSF